MAMSVAVSLFLAPMLAKAADSQVLRGYNGPKCVIAVGEFGVRIKGAPEDLGDGIREMLITALFESNRFIVVDRTDVAGLTAEQLLSESFMADPDAILEEGRMRPAELIVHGAIVIAEAGGAGLRVKIPWVPTNIGAKHHLARVVLDIRVVDSAGGEVVAAHSIEGTAHSGGAVAGAAVGGLDIPVSLEVVRNTPIELAIRDGIYRLVISLSESIPPSFFRVKE